MQLRMLADEDGRLSDARQAVGVSYRLGSERPGAPASRIPRTTQESRACPLAAPCLADHHVGTTERAAACRGTAGRQLTPEEWLNERHQTMAIDQGHPGPLGKSLRIIRKEPAGDQDA